METDDLGAIFAREAASSSLRQAGEALDRGANEIAETHIDNALRRIGEMLTLRYPDRAVELHLPKLRQDFEIVFTDETDKT
jgi:hypothetical protein